MLRELARHCGSTALALSMHTHLLAFTVWRWREGQPVEPLLRQGQWHIVFNIVLPIALPLIMSVYAGVAEAASDLARGLAPAWNAARSTYSKRSASTSSPAGSPWDWTRSLSPLLPRGALVP